MANTRTYDVGATLAPFNIWFWNAVWL